MTTENLVARKDVTVLDMLSSRLRDSLWMELYGPKLVANMFISICDHLDDQVVRDLAVHAVTWMQLDSGEELFHDLTHAMLAPLMLLLWLLLLRLLFNFPCWLLVSSNDWGHRSVPSR